MKANRLMFFVGMLAALSGAALGAGPQYNFDSRAYHIITNVDRALSKEIGEHMDAVYAEYDRRFSQFSPKAAQKHDLYVFQTQQQYMGFLASHGIDATGSGGMFFVAPDGSGLCTFVEGQSFERMYHTLQHEGFHQFAYARIGASMPAWTNEGIAEYFGEAIMVNHHLMSGQVPPDRLARIRQFIKANRHIAFSELLNMSQAAWNNNVVNGEGSFQYDESWSIVHFLVHGDPRYRAAFNRYLTLVANGASSREALSKAFGTEDYTNFEAAWRKFIVALEPNPEKTAAQRLEFLAYGIRAMQEAGRPIESLDQIKSTLQAAKFRIVEPLGHGMTVVQSATDAENFEAPEPDPNPLARPGMKQRAATLELEKPAAPNLPPGAVVKGLKLTVRLIWQCDTDGALMSRIVYE